MLEKEFEDEKMRDIAADETPEELAVEALPGWGDWAGEGVKQKPKKEEEKPKKQRRDDKLKHVIINEKAAKSAPKVLVKAPKREGVATIEQYEKAMAMPIGKDWNTSRAFKMKTRPEVEIKKGEVITPISTEDASDAMKAERVEKKKQERRDRTWQEKRPQTRISRGVKA